MDVFFAARQRCCDRSPGELWPVVLFTEMRRHYLLQARWKNGRSNLRCCVVGKVPISTTHAALEKRRITRFGEPVRVMVALQYQRAAPCEPGQDVRARMAQIRQQTQPRSAVVTRELQGFSRVMRNRERQHFHCTQVHRDRVAGYSQQSAKVGLTDGHIGAVAHPYRNAISQGDLASAADMVCVFVGDKDGIDLVGRHAGLRQPAVELPDPKSAIHQQVRDRGSAARLNDSCVTGTAAAQALESDGARGGPADLLQVVGDDLDDALRVDRSLGSALRIEHRDRRRFALAA